MHHLPPTTYHLPLTTCHSDVRRPDVLQVFLKDSRITAVVIALDNERMTTGSVRALKRLYPEMPIFVRATDEKHRRKLASAGATALETGPRESALLLGGALLSSMGMPAEEVWPQYVWSIVSHGHGVSVAR